jgi:6-pyruvoyltetrahydropterin/6-carboxytetrahydropterin synthase
MPHLLVTRRVHFNAAHRLHNPALSDAENARLFGPCNNLNGHGHNYELEVTVLGPPDPVSGYTFDLGELKDLIETHLVSLVDHKHLNLDVAFMKGIIPSSENFAWAIWNQLAPHINSRPHVSLYSVKLWETPRNVVEVRADLSGVTVR